MLSYFQTFYIDMQRGVSYLPTQLATILAVVFLLNDTQWTVKGVARRLAEGLACFAGVSLASAALYALFPSADLDKVVLMAFTALYAVFFSKYEPRVKLVYSVVYVASYMVIFAVSEPFGVLISQIDERYWVWAQHLTWVTVILLLFGVVWWLRHFSTRKIGVAHAQFVLLLCAVSAMIVFSQILYIACSGAESFRDTPANYKRYNQYISMFLLVIELLTYYLYYSVAKMTRENDDLLTLRHKAEMEEEKFQANRVNYDDLRALRHELKNHNFYMVSLLEAGKYDELADYLKRVANTEADHLQSFDSGNYMVDVVMNHAVNEARQRGVAVQPQIVVPRTLPYDETDMCSLLSNLLDNAIEAASQSGAQAPSVTISMLPRQDYLFIRVTNDVDDSIPAQQRLTLKTTKKQFNLHGYGTKVIKSVAEKYHGSVKFDMADGRFIVDVMLELPRENASEEASA